MTGYGAAKKCFADTTIDITIQSFNNKFLEVYTQVPSVYASMESSIKKYVKNMCHRGSVKITINRQPAYPVQISKITWNKQQADKWIQLYRTMARELKLSNTLDLASLIDKPGVLNYNKNAILSSLEKQYFIQLVKKALQICDAEKKREGIALKKIFHSNLKQLTRSLKAIKHYANQQKKKIQKNLLNKSHIEAYTNNSIAQDTSTLINRLDISEEIARMKEHIKVCSSLLRSKHAVGKKMNFYLQEMIREMNTIGSKSQYFKLIHETVSAKSYIEIMREQVQNVE